MMLWDARPAPPVSPGRLSSRPILFSPPSDVRFWETVQCEDQTPRVGSPLAPASAQQTALARQTDSERTEMARRPQASRGPERSPSARWLGAPMVAI